MNYEAFYNNFSKTLHSLIPDKKELISFISETLHIDKRTVSRRLYGDYQFRIDEILELCSILEISLDRMIPQIKSNYFPPSLAYYPFDKLTEKEYNSMYKWFDRFNLASKEAGSYALMSSNILPEIFCFQYENLTRFAKLKWDYYMNELPTTNYMEIEQVLEPEHLKAIRKYITSIFKFEKLLIVWDYNIIPSIIKDIKYFTQIGYLNPEHKELLKKDVFSLIHKIDTLCTNRSILEGCRDFTFAISSTNLPKSHFILKGENFKIAVDSAFYTTYLYVRDTRIVDSVEHIIWSTLKSSVIISHSNEKERLKFITEQKELIEAI